MNEIVPPSEPPDQTVTVTPERCREILFDILSSPALTNGEREAAADFTALGYSPSTDSYHEAVLAAARWAFQHGGLSICMDHPTGAPHLTVVR